MAAAIRRALGRTRGQPARLPPRRRRDRADRRAARATPADVDLHRLHGSLDPAAQRAALAPPPPGTAQAGARHRDRRDQPDPRRGAHRRRSAASPAGRATTAAPASPGWSPSAPARPRSPSAPAAPARQGPGARLPPVGGSGDAGLPRFDPPEILEADLSALLLDCALWGVADPRALAWLDPPPAAAIDEARQAAARLGALDEDGRPTAHGRAIAALPLPPRLAHMLIEAAGAGLGRDRGRGRGAALRARARRQRRRPGARA